MSGSGDTKVGVVDFVLGGVGMLVIAGVILLGAGLGFLLGLPYVITGLIVGVIASWVMISGSFAGTFNASCPECGHRQKVSGIVDSFQCSNCGQMVSIKKKEPEITLYSAFPTD